MLSHSHTSVESATAAMGSLFKRCIDWMSSEAGDLVRIYSAKTQVEPRVSEVEGQDGELMWEVYNPMNGRVVYCMSEEEVMLWLDTHEMHSRL